jgi:hypothetical protein
VQLGENEIKTGDYVAVSGRFVGNVSTDPKKVSSLYVNPDGIEFVAYGTEINHVHDPDTLFGRRTHTLPPGASLTPLASSHGVGMPGMGGMQPAQQPGMMPGMGGMQPAHDFVQNAGMQQPGMMPGNR